MFHKFKCMEPTVNNMEAKSKLTDIRATHHWKKPDNLRLHVPLTQNKTTPKHYNEHISDRYGDI